MRHWSLLTAISGSVLLAALLVFAVPEAARGEPNCTCRYGGQSHALGTCTCIVTPSGSRLACCARVLNNTSWNFIKNSCPMAEAPAQTPPAPPTDDAALPAAPNQTVPVTPVAG